MGEKRGDHNECPINRNHLTPTYILKSESTFNIISHIILHFPMYGQLTCFNQRLNALKAPNELVQPIHGCVKFTKRNQSIHNRF